MKRIILVVATIVVAVGVFLLFQRDSSPPVLSQETVRMSFTVRNKSGEMLKQSELVLSVPRKHSSTHRLVKLKVQEPYALIEDESGNQAIKVSLDVPPYGTRMVHLEEEIIFPGKDDSPPGLYLGEEPGIEISDQSIQQLAVSLKRPDKRSTIASAMEWIRQNLRDEGYVAKDRGAKEALRLKSGDCTEYAALLVSILRVNNIPARVIGGFPFENSRALRADRYHNWVEYFDGSTWKAVDPFLGVEDPKEYIAFRAISPSGSSVLNGWQRFLAFDSRLEVNMN